MGTSSRSLGGRLLRFVPGVRVARRYRPGWLRDDLQAGIVLTVLLVPQGMAYAALAGLPPATGLYATMVPLVAYALFGPSRILVLGPDSAVAPVIFAAVVPVAGADIDRRVALAGALAVLAGGLMVVGGLTGFAFVTDLISLPVRIGYLLGIAATVIVGQLPRLVGSSSHVAGLAAELRALPSALADGDAAALVLGVGSLAVILACKALNPRIPGVLVAVGGSTVAVAALGLADRVDTVGRLPQGLPSLSLPDVSGEGFLTLTLTAFAIALVAFADTSVLSRSYATRLGDEVDQDVELVGLGAANILTGLFQGFPISSSSSRTPVAEAAGARTQLTGLVAAVAVGGVLVFAPGLLADLPTATLAAVVIAAVLSIVDIPALRKLQRVHRVDFALALACFAGVALLGVLRGVGVAVALSLATFLWRSWHPHDAVLGRAWQMKGYHDVTRYADAKTPDGLVLYRFDAPLFFANAGVFRERVLAIAASQRPRWLVISAEPITDADSTAAEMLVALDGELDALGVELAFAELKDHVKDTLHRYGFVDRVGRERFFPTVGVAVHSYVAEHHVAWHDWEDESPTTT
jgi:high affinity sulfate transporter 1